jgi:hypothetical protein
VSHPFLAATDTQEFSVKLSTPVPVKPETLKSLIEGPKMAVMLSIGKSTVNVKYKRTKFHLLFYYWID